MSNEPTGNFFRVSHKIVELKEFKALRPTSKVLYFTLCHLRNRFQKRKDYFTRSLRRLMMDSGLSRRAIDTGQLELVKAGFIWMVKHHGKRTQYHIFEFQDDAKVWPNGEHTTVPACEHTINN